MSGDLLTTREAAGLLGVTPSTIKRWSDEGRLPHVRTAGGHRRFPFASVERLREHEVPAPETGGVDDWLSLLLGEAEQPAVLAALLAERARTGAWWRVADGLDGVLIELGERWADGRIGILEEHLASERLSRGIQFAAQSLPVGPDAPRALLLTAEREEHTLGLDLVELVAREAGWRTRWAGRGTPLSEVIHRVRNREMEMVLVSASCWSHDATSLAAQAAALTEAARPHLVGVVLGGRGAWPEVLPYGHRLRSFEALHALMIRATVGRAS